MDYIVFERTNNRFKQVQQVYNRAIHQVQNVSAFEEKYNLFTMKGHLYTCLKQTHQAFVTFV